MSPLEAADYHLYAALSRAAACGPAAADERQQHVEALAAHHEQLRVRAEHCPENFEDRVALVGAEIARIEGRELDAERVYEQAIRSARANGFVHHEALANELAARFYAARGFEKIAHLYRRDARYGYLRWGADGKVRQLDELYPHLREDDPVPGPRSTIGASVDHLDLATVIKVSQAVSGEIVLEQLLDTLMRTAVEHAGAERGLLIRPRGVEPRIEAEATTGRDTVMVRLLGTPATPSDLPDAVLQYVIRTQQSVILDDASAQHPFSADAYLRQHHARSVLCLPLLKQARLIGVLYLENHLAPHVFTPARIAVLKLLASQAAIALENAGLYTDLHQENRERQRAEEALRHSEVYLSEAQRLSHTGSFGWRIATGELLWSEETFHIFHYDRTMTPTVDLVLQRVHPEDAAFVQQTIAHASHEGKDFDVEHRLLMPDGSVTHVHVVAHALDDASGRVEFVGAVMDVTERKRAEETLRHTQAALAHLSRVMTMGELTASIAHEVNQPLAAVVTNGNACLRWLARAEPDLEEARAAVERIIRDGHRASEVIRRMRALAQNTEPQTAWLDLNERDSRGDHPGAQRGAHAAGGAPGGTLCRAAAGAWGSHPVAAGDHESGDQRHRSHAGGHRPAAGVTDQVAEARRGPRARGGARLWHRARPAAYGPALRRLFHHQGWRHGHGAGD